MIAKLRYYYRMMLSPEEMLTRFKERAVFRLVLMLPIIILTALFDSVVAAVGILINAVSIEMLYDFVRKLHKKEVGGADATIQSQDQEDARSRDDETDDEAS